MINKEEREAIDYYTNKEYSFGFETDMDTKEFMKALGIEETDEDTFERHQIRFKTLLNLIEKQENRIKELEEINKEHQKLNGELQKRITKLEEICKGKSIQEMGTSKLYEED